MSGNIPQDESDQVGDVYALVQALFHNAVHEGYDRHAIAEALICGARDVLANDAEFLAAYDRFKMLHTSAANGIEFGSIGKPPIPGRSDMKAVPRV